MAEQEQFDELFFRLRSGDKLAYEKIYQLYNKDLLHLAFRKTRDKIVAEDLVQNIFISVWEKRESLKVQNGWAYLYGALKYAIINHIRAQVMQNKFISASENNYMPDQQSSSSLAEFHELTSLIEEGINTLPEKTQKIFRLSRFEHQSIKMISIDLKISEKTVEYHITRSLKWIKGYLKNHYLFIFIFLHL
jgi:RNA polymerase sigma-70 factor (ECF subfamily)